MAQQKLVLGFDIGGTKIGIGLGSGEGKILAKGRIENVNTYPEDVLPQLVSTAQRLAGEAGVKLGDVAAFGISAPFPADPVNGIMTAPTNNKHWRNVPILQYLKDNLKMDGCFENDANCGALAEWFFGARLHRHDLPDHEHRHRRRHHRLRPPGARQRQNPQRR